jgi:hypothetical protein
MIAEGAFAAQFRQLVIPAVAHLCRREGLRLALGTVGFTGARQVAMRMAIKRGALHLPGAVFNDLSDWIEASLLSGADAFEPKIRETRAMCDRIFADNDRYFAAFAAAVQSSDLAAWDWEPKIRETRAMCDRIFADNDRYFAAFAAAVQSSDLAAWDRDYPP